MMDPQSSSFWVTGGGGRCRGSHAHEVADTNMTADCRAVTAAWVLTSLQGMINNNGGGMCKTPRLLYCWNLFVGEK
jgi:hypothetical protein